MRILLLAFFLLSGILTLNAQCPDGYLIDENYTISSEDVYYASNTNVLGDTIDLFMTIYTPNNDTFSERPLVIFAFGGAFVSGDRNDPIMTGLCEQFARKGYVAATIDYRLFPSAVLGSPDSLELVDASIKAIGDMKGAIRFFRQSAEEGNPYKVNPDYIVVGGFSAGAFTALHTTYLDENDELPAGFDSLVIANGGLEGSTGDAINQTYSSEVQACIAFSGALFDPSFLDMGEPQLFLLHGSDDETVPVGVGRSVETVTTYGSDVIFTQAQKEFVNVAYTKLVGAGHVDYWFPIFYVVEKANFFASVDTRIRDEYCPLLNNAQQSVTPTSFTIYPNPVGSQLFVSLPAHLQQSEFQIMDLYGRIIMEGQVFQGQEIRGLQGLPQGQYVFRLPDIGTKFFLKQ